MSGRGARRFVAKLALEPLEALLDDKDLVGDAEALRAGLGQEAGEAPLEALLLELEAVALGAFAGGALRAVGLPLLLVFGERLGFAAEREPRV